MGQEQIRADGTIVKAEQIRAGAIIREWLSNEGVTVNVRSMLDTLAGSCGVLCDPKVDVESKKRFQRFMRSMLGTAFQIGRHSGAKKLSGSEHDIRV